MQNKAENPAGTIDLVLDPAKGLWLSDLYYLVPDLQVVGTGSYDQLDISLAIDPPEQSYLSFFNPATMSQHFNITWPNVTDRVNFKFSFFLCANAKSLYTFVDFHAIIITTTAGAATTQQYPLQYSITFHP